MYFIHGFLQLNAGESVTITADNGWSMLSVKNNSGSSGNVTITGNTDRYIGNKQCGSITLSENESISIGDSKGIITNITISCATGTTCKIVAIAYKQIIP